MGGSGDDSAPLSLAASGSGTPPTESGGSTPTTIGLSFLSQDYGLSDKTEDEKRQAVVDLLEPLVGLGADDMPRGRMAAYASVIAPWASTNRDVRDWIRTSSCMLVVACLWRCLGVSDSKLRKIPFGKVGIYLDTISRKQSAQVFVVPNILPKPGDFVLIGGAGSAAASFGGVEHMLTVESMDGILCTSVDGGQPDRVLASSAIARRTREFQWRGQQLWLTNPGSSYGGRRVQKWIDVSKLALEGDLVLMERCDGYE